MLPIMSQHDYTVQILELDPDRDRREDQVIATLPISKEHVNQGLLNDIVDSINRNESFRKKTKNLRGNDLLVACLARIKEHPEKYDARYWCGTAYCLAGTALVLAGELEDGKEGYSKGTYCGRAAELLRFTPAEASMFFNTRLTIPEIEAFVAKKLLQERLAQVQS